MHHTFALLTASFVAVLLPTPLRADDPKADSRLYEAGAKVEGKTPAEWAAAWWQWAAAIKKDRNPCLDKTGEFAGEGQTEKVFFLAGNVGGKSARKCSVPAGKPIFFPVINWIENADPDKADEKKLKATATAAMDQATDLEVTLDGKAISGVDKMRVASAVFAVSAPEKKADAAFDDVVGKQTAVTDGYWVSLKPLAAGKHTLTFKAKLKATKDQPAFELEVSYELTAEEKK